MSVGVKTGWVAHTLYFLSLQKQSWQWIDGSLDQYIPWNYKTKSEARHCAALNPKDSKFPAALPFLQAATPSLNLLRAKGACLASSHRPFHSAALPHRTWPRHAVYEPPVACTHSAVFAKASEGHFFLNISGRGHEVTDYDKDVRGKC